MSNIFLTKKIISIVKERKRTALLTLSPKQLKNTSHLHKKKEKKEELNN